MAFKQTPSHQIDTSDPAAVGSWLADEQAELVESGANEILADWLTSHQDSYAAAKASRQLFELAAKVGRLLEEANEARAKESREQASEARSYARDARSAA